MSFRVRDVYAGQSVLITGGTGFLGKVLIEKLLYSVPDVGKIFLIIRHSKGAAPKARLDKILQDPLFDRLKKENPSAFDKLVPIEGDLLEEHLGISPHDLQILSSEVSIVIHSAATVKFDEELRDAVAMNVSGTTRLIALCHKMNNLISLVHVSTAYANCNLSETEEKIYEPPIPPQKFVEALNWMDDEMVKLITPRLLGNRPNTYTLTKALAEKQLHEDAGTLPVIVIRPSIVGAMWGSPLPGWTDNMNGPTGIFSAVGKGVLTNMCGSDESNADIIPVDIVANMIIVAAAHRAHVSYDKIPIMHCASGDLNPLKWGKIVVFLEQFYDKYPMDQCYAVPSTHFHKSRFFFKINHNIRHELPAKMLDLVYGMAGQKKMFVKLYSRVWKMIETLHFFTTRGWTFHSKQLPILWDTLHDEDKKEFNFDIRQVNWDEYLCDYAFGVKKYIMKDNMNNLRQARRNLTMLKLAKLALQGIFWYVMVRLFGNRQTKKNQWIAWAAGLVLSQLYSRSIWRPKAYLKSLEEFKQTHYV